MSNIVTVEEIEDLPNHPTKLLIDVRDPPELKNTGQIPCSINIPRKYTGLIYAIEIETPCFAFVFVFHLLMTIFFVSFC